jgi:xanthine phosphoribosyltransferase
MSSKFVHQTVSSVGIVERQPILNLGWDAVEAFTDVIAHEVKGKFHQIVGIARGGLIPATILSQKLDLVLNVIHVSTYQGTRRTLEKSIQVEGWDQSYASSKILFVDDIMDTGNTWKAILERCTGTPVTLHTLCMKPHNLFSGWTNYRLKVPNDVWVRFPWEPEL